MMFCCFNQLEANFFFSSFSILLHCLLLFFFFKVTSLFAQRCAIGVMLRVCCVICCHASASGMWILSLFFLLRLSPFLSKEDQQSCHNNRGHSLKQCVMKLRKAVCLVCVCVCVCETAMFESENCKLCKRISSMHLCEDKHRKAGWLLVFS